MGSSKEDREEDKLLIRKIKHGDEKQKEDALTRLYEKYKDDVVHEAGLVLHNKSDIPDVLQDTFLPLLQSPQKIKYRGNLKPFLRICAANKARDKNRKRKLESRDWNEGNPERENAIEIDKNIKINEQAQMLRIALSQLDHKKQKLVSLHIYEEMTFLEMAKYLNRNVNTIKTQYYTAVDKLRSILDREKRK